MEGGLAVLFEFDAGDELRQDDEVQDDGRGQQGVLTGVVQHDGVLSAQEDLTGVLVQGALAVTHVRDIPVGGSGWEERHRGKREECGEGWVWRVSNNMTSTVAHVPTLFL